MFTTAMASTASGRRRRTLTAHGAAGGGLGRDRSDTAGLFVQLHRSTTGTLGGRIKTGQKQFKFGLTLPAFVTENRHIQRTPVRSVNKITVLRPRRPDRANLNTLPRSSRIIVSCGVVVLEKMNSVLFRLNGRKDEGAK